MGQGPTAAAAAKQSESAATAPTPSRPQADPHPLAAHAAAAMPSFDRLAQVEMQLVMQCCDKVTLLRLKRCSRSTLSAASHSFAWRSLPPLEVECESPLELSWLASQSLLHHAALAVRWDMPVQSSEADSHGAEGVAGGGADEQRAAAEVAAAEVAAAEVAALAALPGLRHLQVCGRSADVARLCSGLLANVDGGGALPLASLRVHMVSRASLHGDCQSLSALLARSRTLQTFTANGNLGSDAIRCLADGIRQSQSLTTLNLSRNDVGEEGAFALAAAVAGCRTLTDLQLEHCAMTDGGAEALIAALIQRDSSIRTLNMGLNKLTHAVANSLTRLLSADRCALESLDLSYCPIGDEGAPSLAAGLRTNRTLTELRLACCRMQAAGTSVLLAALHSNPHIPLRQLVLSHSIDVAGATSLAEFLRANPTLEQLNLNGSYLGDAAVAVLASALPAARSLRDLRLRSCSFRAAGATALAAGVAACPSLTMLDVGANGSCRFIRGHGMLDAGVAALAPSLLRLHNFDAGNCSLTFASAARLVDVGLLRPDSRLHTLDLYANAIGTAGVLLLAAQLHSSSPLRALDLSACDMDAEGAAALAEALRRGWPATHLRLNKNRRIRDDGARALAAALEGGASDCPLRSLCLDDCGLTLAGGLALVRAALAVPSLRSLSMCRTLTRMNKPALRAACGARPRFQLEL